MVFALVLFALYAIPISLGIIALYWILKKLGHDKAARISRTYLFILLGIAYVGFNAHNWLNTHHTMKLEIENQYSIRVKAHDIEAFLDWPVDFDVEISDLSTGIDHEFEFFSEGPFYRILILDNHAIWFKGYNYSQGQHQVLYFENDVLKTTPPNDSSGFQLKAEMTTWEIIRQ